MPSIHAILPAAGRSSRMGQPKQLMAIDGQPMLLAVIEPVVACESVERTVVVTNSLVASAIDLNHTGVSVVLNDEPDTGMIDSIRMGIDHLQHGLELHVDDGLMICPGDQPGLTFQEIETCCRAFHAHRGRITVATHDGKHGHPLIIPASRIPFLMSQACDLGLRELVLAHTQRVTRGRDRQFSGAAERQHARGLPAAAQRLKDTSRARQVAALRGGD